MHHRFATSDHNKPTLSGGAAAELPHPNPPDLVTMAIDRRMEQLRDMTIEAEPIRRLLDTGPPQQPLCLAA